MGKHFIEIERRKIEAWLEMKMSKAEIARRLNKSYSSVCREIKRGLVLQTESSTGIYKEVYFYKSDFAQIKHDEAMLNKGRCPKLSFNSSFKQALVHLIKKGYSPEVALRKLKKTYPKQVCFKTVYNAIDRGDFDDLTLHDLFYKKAKQKPKIKKAKRIDVTRRSIDERPKEILNRLDFGHWEMDCIVSGQCTSSKAALLVITERKTRFSYIYKIPDKTQQSVKNVLDKLERKYQQDFKKIFKTITMDNGVEFINQDVIENSVLKPNEKRITAYYCHPYSAFERGSNENYNRFIRRFIKKGSDIKKITQGFIKQVMDFINDYPRKMFDFQSSSFYLKENMSIPIIY